jgi:glucose/mannose-6-phosphate isomerase
VNNNIDFEKLREQVDPTGMLALVQSFSTHMEDAWGIGRDFAGGLDAGEYRQVVVCGMGGSAIGGDMLRSFFGDRLKAPLLSVRDYKVPAHVGAGSFVLISS